MLNMLHIDVINSWERKGSRKTSAEESHRTLACNEGNKSAFEIYLPTIYSFAIDSRYYLVLGAKYPNIWLYIDTSVVDVSTPSYDLHVKGEHVPSGS